MRPVRREEILDPSGYEPVRAQVRAGILAAKARRRVHVGGVLTFLFENTATIRYQVQELVRAERLTREEDVHHELETYNELLGGAGELGVTLLVELPDPAERDRRLREWLGLPGRLYLRLAGGERVRPTFDPRQVGEDRLSSVQYLRFDVRGQVPVAVGVDLLGLTAETTLGEEERSALRADLAGDDAGAPRPAPVSPRA
jgi:hypothetical protein